MIEVLFCAALFLGLGFGLAQAKTYISQQQAIENAFPNGGVERKTLFLTPEQVRQIEERARVKVDSRLVSYYLGKNAAGEKETLFFDRQLVRTLPATFMVAVNAGGDIDRVEILAFDEPDDYLPPLRWLGLYRGRRLGEELRIGQAIPHITGASLSSQAVNDGVRRALATFEVCLKGAQ